MYPNACFLATFLLSCRSSLIKLLPASCQLLAITAHLELAITLECLARRHETDNCLITDLISWNSIQLSTWVEELGSCWSLLSSSKTKSWAGLKALVMQQNLLLGFLLLRWILCLFPLPHFQPILWNLFSGVHSLISLQKHSPHGTMAGWEYPGLPNHQSVLCHLPAGPHHLPSCSDWFGADLSCSR